MNYLSVLAGWLWVACLPLMILSASIASAVNNPLLYQQGFEKYSVGAVTGLADSELGKAARGIISYFNSTQEPLNIIVEMNGAPFPLFNEREIAHMRDVKALFHLDYAIFLGTFIYAFGYQLLLKVRRRENPLRLLAWRALAGSGITFGILLLLGIAALADFESLFLRFHLISFANDLWLLDPSKDYLLMLFPGGFWYDAAMRVGQLAALKAVLLAVAASLYLWGGRLKALLFGKSVS